MWLWRCMRAADGCPDGFRMSLLCRRCQLSVSGAAFFVTAWKLGVSNDRAAALSALIEGLRGSWYEGEPKEVSAMTKNVATSRGRNDRIEQRIVVD